MDVCHKSVGCISIVKNKDTETRYYIVSCIDKGTIKFVKKPHCKDQGPTAMPGGEVIKIYQRMLMVIYLVTPQEQVVPIWKQAKVQG